MPGPDNDDTSNPVDEEALDPPEPPNLLGQKRSGVVPVVRHSGETRVDAMSVKKEDAVQLETATKAVHALLNLLLRIDTSVIKAEMIEAEERAKSKKIRRKIRRMVSRIVPLAVAVVGVSCAGAAIAVKSIGDGMNGIFEYFTLPKIGIANNTTLEGATLKFVCQKFPNASLQPIDVLDYYQTSQLLNKPFNVSFNKVAATEAFPLSIAKSGWGTTINFTNDQLLSGISDELNAISVEVREYGRAYYLPTGAFIADPDKKTSYVFTTGLVDAAGEAVNYYLTGSDGNSVCDIKQGGQLSGGPNRVRATLKSQLD